MGSDESSNADTAPKPRARWRRWVFPDRKARGWKAWVHWLASRLVLWYLVIVVMLSLLQRKLIYFPRTSGRLEAATVPPRGSVHDIEVQTEDGLTLHGWHFLPRGTTLATREECDAHLATAKCVVLYFHGNAGNRSGREGVCRAFTDCGADVFLFDYRGYAENPGSPSEASFLADGRAIWNYATKTRKISPERIVLFGESLGGGVAAPLAAQACRDGERPMGLVLWAAFPSLVAVGRHHYPWLPVSLMLRDRYESIMHAPEIHCPVLQLHGNRDRIVPMELGRELHAAFPESGISKQWLELPDVGHNDLPLHRLREAFRGFVMR